MKKLSLGILLLFTFNHVSSQPWEWATELGSLSTPGKFIDSDNNGNFYIAGTYGIGTTIGTYSLSATYNAIYVTKCDSDGTVLWATDIEQGGYSDISVTDIVVDVSGNTYVTGSFKDNAVFENDTLFAASAVAQDIYVAKYDASGNYLWAIQGGGDYNQGFSLAGALEVNNAGNLLVSGRLTTTNPNLNGTALGFTGIFAAEVSPTTGSVIWIKNLEDLPYVNSHSIADMKVDGSDNIYIAGLHGSKIYIAGDTIYEYSNPDFLLCKLNSSGIAEWARSFGSNHIDKHIRLAVDASGNSYLAGNYPSPLFIEGDTLPHTQANQYEDMFIVKFDNTGNLDWTKYTGGNNDDFMKGISAAANGNILVYGEAGFDTLTLDGNTIPKGDIFIMGYDASGNSTFFNNTDAGAGGPGENIGDITVAGKAIAMCSSKPPSAQFGTITTSAGWSGVVAKLYYPAGTVGISQKQEKATTIYPNPSNGTFTIEKTSGKDMGIITDVNGRTLMTIDLLNRVTPVSLNLTKGIYFLKTASQVHKLIIQ